MNSLPSAIFLIYLAIVKLSSVLIKHCSPLLITLRQTRGKFVLGHQFLCDVKLLLFSVKSQFWWESHFCEVFSRWSYSQIIVTNWSQQPIIACVCYNAVSLRQDLTQRLLDCLNTFGTYHCYSETPDIWSNIIALLDISFRVDTLRL